MKTFLHCTIFLFLANVCFSQNVGIGTTNPAYKLDVRSGSINVDSLYRINTITVLSVKGTGNLHLGKYAGSFSSGSFNTFSGDNSGYNNGAGSDNSFFGCSAGKDNLSGTNNSFFGRSAGSFNNSGDNNSFFGRTAGYSNTVGDNNSFFGHDAGAYNLIGSNNSFFGNNAGYSNFEGGYNSFFGESAGYFNTTGTHNSFFGESAGHDNTTGIGNSFFGKSAGLENTTGAENTFIGISSGKKNSSGSSNTFSGELAGSDNTTGGFNSYYGRNAGFTNTTGSQNTAIGYLTNFFFTDLTNATALGYNAVVDASNKVRIGNGTVNSNGGQVNWTAYSDERIKDNIQENVVGLAFIKELHPITFHYNIDKQNDILHLVDTVNFPGKNDLEHIQFSGFLAQEVDAAAKKVNYDFSGVDKSGEILGLRYAEFTVPLIKAMQEQQGMIEAQNAKIMEQGLALSQQQEQIDELKKLVLTMTGNK